jgi:polyether ionophore transport system permease protein
MSPLTGTPALLGLMLRRDRVVVPICVLVAVAWVVLTAASFQGLYPTVAERAHFAVTIRGNSTFQALYGPPRALNSIGGLTSWRIGSTVATVVALMSLLLVGRHTRGDEERGRTELMCAGAVGRHAPIAAALALVAVFDTSVAALVALGLIALGLPAAGSVALGAALGATGLVFAGVGAVAAQLTGGARAANGIAGAVLGAAYLLRAAGDSGDGTLSWLSPIGWGKATRPFDDERWWPLLLGLAALAALAALAFALLARRDLGAGMIPTRPGPPTAGRHLRGPLGLAWRLQRGGLLAWSAGLFLGGLVIGSIGQNADELVESNNSIGDFFTRSGGVTPADAFFGSILLLMALIATGYTISSALRLRGEERAGHVESLLSGPVGRVPWAASHVAMSMAGSAVVLLAGGLGMGLAHALGSDDAGQIPRLMGAALAQVPAVWVLGSLVLALFGLVPRAVALSWAALAGCALLWFLGPLTNAPQWLLDVSPFEHVPAVPAVALSAGPLLVLSAIAVALSAAGLAGFSRRDVG